jgi:hypothetical protein
VGSTMVFENDAEVQQELDVTCSVALQLTATLGLWFLDSRLGNNGVTSIFGLAVREDS